MQYEQRRSSAPPIPSRSAVDREHCQRTSRASSDRGRGLMAGRGPAPGANPNRKPAGQRRGRASEPQFEALPERHDGSYPALPATYLKPLGRGKTSKVKFLAETREWYEAWATSPMACEWTNVHFLRLRDIAGLQDRFLRGEQGLAAELRLQLAGFGGTPMDLRRLGKRIVSSEGGLEKPAVQRATVTRLRAV